MKEYEMVFLHKANLSLASVIPQREIVTKTKGRLKEKEIQQHTEEWQAFLWCMMHNRKVEVTIKILVPEPIEKGEGK